MQLALGVMGALVFIAIFLFLPEPSHPGARGVDKLQAGSSKFVFVNPLRPLWLLRSPNLLLTVSLNALSLCVLTKEEQSLGCFSLLLSDYGPYIQPNPNGS
jgi:hypothetical protein